MTRQAVVPGEPVALPGGLQAELFTVPGKVPLYLEGENPQTASETGGQCRRRDVGRERAHLPIMPGAPP